MEIILEEEIVGIAWGWSQHDDGRYDVVLKQTCGWRAEGPVTSPDFRERQDAFTTQFLYNYTS